MSLDALETEDRPVTTPDDLLSVFRSAERRSGPLLIGLEHEKLLFPAEGIDAVPYEGGRGVGALLEALVSRGWEAVRESPERPIIALRQERRTVSLEPGGQFELSGSPHSTARAAHEENLAHLEELREVTRSLGLCAVGLGYRPFEVVSQMPWMPKSRYRLMRTTLGARGSHAHHMMLMTATGQVSLDWTDEADCARKVTAAARLVPVVIALFANSPIAQGRDAGFASFRSRVWNDVDPARCGVPHFMLDGSFSYRSYVEWGLDAPMLFLRRGGEYLDPRMTFRQLLSRGWKGKPAQHSDWVDHLSTLFPEARIKQVLEIRSADANGSALTGALAALMRGLLYDRTALDEVGQALPALGPTEHEALRRAAQRDGLRALLGTSPLAALAREVVEIARRGLLRLDPLDAPLLDPLLEVAAGGRSPSDRVRESFAARAPSDFLAHHSL